VKSISHPEAELAPAPERPQLAENVQLVGELPDTAFVDRQWLIQRDGQFVQLTELLYRIVELLDGERTLDEIAEDLSESTRWLVTADQVEQLIASKLMPLAIVAGVDGAVAPRTPPPASGVSPLAVNMRVKAIGPRVIEPVTRVLQYLFAPPVVVAVVIGAPAAHFWLYRERGLLAAFIDALYTPGVLLILLGVVLASAVFHEFGHASALRYGGGHARQMGAGFYAIFPVFFTDATDSYRLGRWARVRTGLGGVYFHLIFALAVMGVAIATGNEFLLLAVLLINLEIVHQFIPFVRLDGYWILTDLTGVPDFFSQTGPFLRSLLPSRVKAPGTKLPPLKPWAKGVFIGYIALMIPAIAFLLVLMIKRLPGIVTVAWDAILTNVQIVRDASADGDFLAVATSLTQILILALPLLGIGYLLYMLTWRPLRAAWRQPTPARRFSGVAAMAVIVGGVAFFWAPRLPFAAETPPAGVKTFEVSGNQHVRSPVSYPQSPPVGGNHDPVWQDCGFYAAPVGNEHAVHSLEHGAVWITYRPGLAPSQVDSLRSLAKREDRVLVSPYPGLSSKVVASAWGRQLAVDSASDARIDRFVQAFRNDSKAPEAGGPCSGGRRTPR
jgi:putative peptide zinc metalloprotease protein